MSPPDEIEFDKLIDRTIKDFEPVERLWPVSTRLLWWIVLELALIALTILLLGSDATLPLIYQAGLLFFVGLPFCASVAAACFALRSAVPGREVTRRELASLIAVVCGIASVGLASSPVAGPFAGSLRESIIATLNFLALAAVPWVALFEAVRRGVPLQPTKTGALVGLAASCWALADHRFISEAGAWSNQAAAAIFAGIFIIVFSALAGTLWLDWITHWQDIVAPVETKALKSTWGGAITVFPVAITVSIIGLIFVLRGLTETLAPIPDFDLAIEHYERSLSGFHSNVPSSSIDTMLTAYVEHGMPAYMWDFGREGFKLVGGQWKPLADGTPTTYTWFRGAKGGVICMIKQVEEFNPRLARTRNIIVFCFTNIAVSASV
jgi:Negative regulator of sigma F